MRDKLASTPVYIDRAEFTGRSFDVLAHRHDQILIVELEERREPSSLSWFDLYSGLSAAVSKLEATVTLQSFLNLAAQEIRSFSGFDRVMIYKFMEDKSGWVRSEALAERLEPYLGLHYPSSDIPEPARRLLSLTWVLRSPGSAWGSPSSTPLAKRNTSHFVCLENLVCDAWCGKSRSAKLYCASIDWSIHSVCVVCTSRTGVSQ